MSERVYPDLDQLVDEVTKERKWQPELEFKKIITDGKWDGRIICSGPCLTNNPPLKACYPGTETFKFFNGMKFVKTLYISERVSALARS